MKAYNVLPEGYREIFSLDLKKQWKPALLVNALAAVLFFAMAVPMHFYIPFYSLFRTAEGVTVFNPKTITLFLGSVVYIILHEAVHGIAMKICGTKKVKYGFTGAYAYAGSSDFYDKSGYIFIALAPVVLWGIVLALLSLCVPGRWLWVVYFIQITNISGAAGDFYVTYKFSRMPKDILVTDYGVGMRVYSME